MNRPADVEDLIKAARMMFPRVYMDESDLTEESDLGYHGCKRLLECLRRFRRNIPKTTDEPATPMKNEFRHGADMFGYLGMIVDKLDNNIGGTPPPKYEEWEPSVPGVM